MEEKNKNIGIYSITNVINGKRYIGQSTNIKKRWQRHINDSKNPKTRGYEYPLCRAIRKYGIEYFDFQILENCLKDQLDEREKYWIDFYDAMNSGYNQVEGGSNASRPIKLGSKIDDLKADLRECRLTYKTIADKYGITARMVSKINNGVYWYDDDTDYPIRKTVVKYDMRGDSMLSTHTKFDGGVCVMCGVKTYEYKNRFCVSCYKKQKSAHLPSKEELLNDILSMPMTQVGKKYGVTDKSACKWCQKYGLPCKKDDIKKLRESLK